ncbi:MAG: ribonuclease Z [Clostridiales bacterium]|nr:ribonuclease Z [Clostridiales bacterium]
MIDVCLLGTGGMMPLPDRYLTSLYVRCEGKCVLIDCGEGTQSAIRAAGRRFKPIDTLLLTHYHADHISGLPGLLLTLGNEDRTQPLDVYGPPGLRRLMAAIKVIVPEVPFEIICHELEGDVVFRAGELTVRCFKADHSVPCFGYCLTKNRPGRFDPEKARLNRVPMRLWARLQQGEECEGFVPAMVLGSPRRGLKLVYATDTLPLDCLAEIGREADLMVLEGMFGGTDKDERALETRHSTMNQSALLAKRAMAKELWLTHYSPANPHPEEYADEVMGIFSGTVISVDGQQTTLRFQEDV